MRTIHQNGAARLRTFGVGMAAVALLLVSIAGCGSSGGSSSGSSTSGEIPIGNIGTYSGPNSTDFASGGKSLKAWAEWINDQGGINGRKVHLYQMDDGGSPSTALSDAKELIQKDHVVAIVGQMSTPAATWAKYVADQGVPVIGGNPSDPLFFTNPDFFPGAATANASFATIVKAATGENERGAFFYCTENPACSELKDVLVKSYSGAGGKLVNVSPISSSSPSFTPECLAAKNAGAQSVYVAIPAETTVTIAQNCAQQGFNPYFLTDLLAITPKVAGQLKGISGFQMLNNSDDYPYFATDTPAIQAFHRAVKKYEPSALDEEALTENAVTAWAAGQLFAAAVKAAGTKNLTPSSIKDGLYALPAGTTLGGLTPPLTFKKGAPTTVSCIYVAAIDSNGLSMPKGSKPFC